MQDPLLYCRKTISRANATQTPQCGGRGAPTCRGRRGRGGITASMAWHGPQNQGCPGRMGQQLGQVRPLLLQNPFLPRGPWPGAGKGLEVGRAPGRLCYQGVSLRKGCRPLPSKAGKRSRGGEGSNTSCWWALDLPQDKGAQLCSGRMLPPFPRACPCARR